LIPDVCDSGQDRSVTQRLEWVSVTAPPAADDEPLDDETAMRAAQRDPARFSVLYARYAKDIERFMLSRTNGDLALSEDLTSQVFTRAYAAIPRYVEGSFRAWLYQIARNTLIDLHRRTRPADSLERASGIAGAEPRLDEQVIAAEAREQLHAALDHLNLAQRAVILLRLQGLTGREIAERLGMSHEAVKSAQYRAMAQLKIRLHHLRDQP
jgi:RNA polymerase sigma-70 factor (ECF subfamily)